MSQSRAPKTKRSWFSGLSDAWTGISAVNALSTVYWATDIVGGYFKAAVSYLPWIKHVTGVTAFFGAGYLTHSAAKLDAQHSFEITTKSDVTDSLLDVISGEQKSLNQKTDAIELGISKIFEIQGRSKNLQKLVNSQYDLSLFTDLNGVKDSKDTKDAKEVKVDLSTDKISVQEMVVPVLEVKPGGSFYRSFRRFLAFCLGTVPASCMHYLVAFLQLTLKNALLGFVVIPKKIIVSVDSGITYVNIAATSTVFLVTAMMTNRSLKNQVDTNLQVGNKINQQYQLFLQQKFQFEEKKYDTRLKSSANAMHILKFKNKHPEGKSTDHVENEDVKVQGYRCRTCHASCRSDCCCLRIVSNVTTSLFNSSGIFYFGSLAREQMVSSNQSDSSILALDIAMYTLMILSFVTNFWYGSNRVNPKPFSSSELLKKNAKMQNDVQALSEELYRLNTVSDEQIDALIDYFTDISLEPELLEVMQGLQKIQEQRESSVTRNNRQVILGVPAKNIHANGSASVSLAPGLFGNRSANSTPSTTPNSTPAQSPKLSRKTPKSKSRHSQGNALTVELLSSEDRRASTTSQSETKRSTNSLTG